MVVMPTAHTVIPIPLPAYHQFRYQDHLCKHAHHNYYTISIYTVSVFVTDVVALLALGTIIVCMIFITLPATLMFVISLFIFLVIITY
jgi:hypothetical protein